MSIIRFTHSATDVPADPVNLAGHHDGAGWTRTNYTTKEESTFYGPRVYWTWETHVGLCLSQYERNGYDDSDFHMIVWNPETNAPENICFASTRGWSYPSYNSFVDATDEVRAAFAAYEAHRRRRDCVGRKLATRNLRNELAGKLGVRPSAIRRLEKAYGQLDGRAINVPSRYNNGLARAMGFVRDEQTIDRIVKLALQADSKRLKNEFRRSLARQVITWLQDPAPKYDAPLSPKQLQYV